MNQAETEEIAAGFAGAGFARVDFGAVADVYVINTCTVTHIADRKSRQLVRQARRLNAQALVVATGCYAEVDPVAVASLDVVDLVVGNRDKERLVDLVLGACPGLPTGDAHAPVSVGRTRAFVKVQTGCDSLCTYCIVPRARGRSRSETWAKVLAEVSARADDGYREVVLTGVHIGAYGRDVPPHTHGAVANLAGLLRAILRETAVERVRLSSLEPEDLSLDLLALWAEEGRGRLCRHFHLPLQSGSDDVLRLMGRRYRTADFARMVDAVRRVVPEAAVTTDLMVGFPGEGEEEFGQSRAFVRGLALAGTHVFKYSPRPGTPASRLPGRVSAVVAKARSEEMIALAAEMAAHFRRGFIGRRLDVLYEDEALDRTSAPTWSGLTDNYIRVSTPCAYPLHNRIEPTLLVGETADGLAGAVGSVVKDGKARGYTVGSDAFGGAR